MLLALGPASPPRRTLRRAKLSEITVTGIRASIATAISMKEQSNDIIETISAEDLGKLPDLSIADSLARLPGLAAQRTDGRSNFISIRDLPLISAVPPCPGANRRPAARIVVSNSTNIRRN